MGQPSGLLIAAASTATNPDPALLTLGCTADSGTDVLTSAVAHGYTTGQKVRLAASGAGALPTGISAGTDYYMNVASATTFTLHPTENDAAAGTNTVNLTSNGTSPFGIVPLLLVAPEPTAPHQEATAWTGLTAAGTYAKALSPRGTHNSGNDINALLAFYPSAGSSVSYTIKVWQYNETFARTNQTFPAWAAPAVGATHSFVGSQTVELATQGTGLWYVQVASISSGTLGIYYENGVLEAF